MITPTTPSLPINTIADIKAFRNAFDVYVKAYQPVAQLRCEASKNTADRARESAGCVITVLPDTIELVPLPEAAKQFRSAVAGLNHVLPADHIMRAVVNGKTSLSEIKLSQDAGSSVDAELNKLEAAIKHSNEKGGLVLKLAKKLGVAEKPSASVAIQKGDVLSKIAYENDRLAAARKDAREAVGIPINNGATTLVLTMALASVNGIEDMNVIPAGKSLKVPTKQKIREVAETINNYLKEHNQATLDKMPLPELNRLTAGRKTSDFMRMG